MSKHTPSPWEVHHEHDVTGYPVFCIHGMSGDQKHDEPTLTANAKLIAAAPDLLAALHALEVSANTLDYCYSKRASNFAAALQALRESAAQARAAIDRATA